MHGHPVEGVRPGEGLDPRWHFAVGPTQLHPAVPAALKEALASGFLSESHRSAPFRSALARTETALRALLGIPDSYRVLLVSSATEAMERLLQGVVGHGSHHLVNGAFARRFRDVAAALGVDASAEEVPDGSGFDLDRVEIPDQCELLAVTQNETSTGVALDPEAIVRLGLRRGATLLAVDAVTATPTAPLELSGVDAAFFSVQKLFGLPPGLGVMVVSPRVVERAEARLEQGDRIGAFFHLPALARAADAQETAATPNSLAIYLLGRVAEALLEEGVEELRARAEAGKARVYEAAKKAGWTPFVWRKPDRSTTVLVFQTPEGSASAKSRLASHGFLVSVGYGSQRDLQLRIANFPSHPMEAIEMLARTIEREG